MEFEIIRGLFPDDIPAPDKPANEWTEEEHKEYTRALFAAAEPGTLEGAIIALDMPPFVTAATITGLAAIKTALEAQCKERGFRNEWDLLNVDCVFRALLCWQESERSRRRQLEANPETSAPAPVPAAI